MKRQWKFLKDGLRSNYDDSRWEIGVWREVPPQSRECVGLNASDNIVDAFAYVKGDILARVECGGEVIHSSDKSTWQKMRIVKAWRWTKRESVMLAVFAARSCLHHFEDKYPSDDRPRKAIEAAEAWLKRDNESTRSAAYSAACSANSAAYSAYSVTWSAAESAARSAARSAADSAYSVTWSARSAADSAYSATWSAAESAANKTIQNYIVKKILAQAELTGEV